MILLSVLLILSLLMALGMGAALSVQNDFRMTANLRGGMAASYLAEAGIESARQQIAQASTMPPTITGGTHVMHPGSYSVSVLSSIQSGLMKTHIVLRSVGVANNATQTIQVRVTKAYDLSDSAVALRGNIRSLIFSGSAFSISGFDHNLTTGAVLSGVSPKMGISVSTATALNQVAAALDGEQSRNIVGDNGKGVAVADSDRIPGADASRIAEELCAAPHATVSGVPSTGNLTIVNETWGSSAEPQLRCVNGLPGSGDYVIFGGNTRGAGILIIRDAEMVLAGDFQWEGLIIVSGGDVGFRVSDPDIKAITGALIVHESGNGTGSGPALLNLGGSVNIRFSRQALDLATRLIPRATLTSSYASLPFTLKRDYWRSINP